LQEVVVDNNPYLAQFLNPASQTLPQNYDEIQGQLDLYERGRMLKNVVGTPVWSLLLEILQSYRDKANEELLNLAPGDETVVTAHAAASALNDGFRKFQQDINAAVEFAANPSPEVTDYLSGVITTGMKMGQSS
jgi:hypothetical protein